jgi:predicted ester cyclase
MNQSKLIEQFMQDLRDHPGAVPPPGLDASMVKFVRKLVTAERTRPASHDVQVRVWQRVQGSMRPGTIPNSVRPPKPSTNYRQAQVNNLKHKEEMKMENVLRGPIVVPGRRAVPSLGRIFALAVAVVGAVLFGGFLLFSLLTSPPGGPEAVYLSPEAANQAVFERYINEAWNAGKTDVLNETLTEDHVCYEPGKPEEVGIEHMAAMIGTYRTAFPDWQFAIEDLVATDDAVWARLVGTGTQSGPFAWAGGVTVEPTDSPVTVEVMIAARFADGKIAEQRFEYDALGLLRQLQVVPSPETSLTEQRNIEVVRQGMDAFNQHDIDAMLAYYAPTFRHSFGVDRYAIWTYPATVERFKWIFEQELWHAFPDLQMNITNLVAAGDTVVVEANVRGTFEHDLTGWYSYDPYPATHRVESWSWLIIWRVDEDGKIVESRTYWDGFPGTY